APAAEPLREIARGIGLRCLGRRRDAQGGQRAAAGRTEARLGRVMAAAACADDLGRREPRRAVGAEYRSLGIGTLTPAAVQEPSLLSLPCLEAALGRPRSASACRTWNRAAHALVHWLRQFACFGF